MSNQPLEASLRSPSRNSGQSSNSPEPIRALLSIKPPFAEAIFSGTKAFEFRRVAFSRAVDIVVVYVTAPVKLVIGEFDVAGMLNEPISQLWETTRSFAGIAKEYFLAYFAGRDQGLALRIGEVRRYARPTRIEEWGVKPPQSFVYL